MSTTRALTPEEISRLDQALAARGRHRDRLFLMLAVSTGYRVSELLTLTIGQLLDATGQVAREVTIARRLLKGGRGDRARALRSRRLVLGDRARTAIAAYLATLRLHPTPDTFVFASRKGVNRPITRSHAHHWLKTLARELGLDADRIGCHSTRRTFAKGVYAASGFDLVKVQKLLGHTNPLTTARYLASDEAELDALAQGFDPLVQIPAPAAAASLPAHPSHGRMNPRSILYAG
jgi:integrase